MPSGRVIPRSQSSDLDNIDACCQLVSTRLTFNQSLFKPAIFKTLMSFAFVPRKFAKAQKPIPQDVGSSNITPVPSTSHIPLTHSHNTANSKGKGTLEDTDVSQQKGFVQGKSRYTDADYANLICLALSDYALWSDSTLRRKIDFSGAESDESNGESKEPGCKLKFLLQYLPR